MAFSLMRPPSPTCDAHPSHINLGHEDNHLASALHAALSTFVPGPSHSNHHHDMNKEKDRAGIKIIVKSDCLILKGTGVDVEPAMLSSHVVLHLTEPTSIKGITLQFRGKARRPAPLNKVVATTWLVASRLRLLPACLATLLVEPGKSGLDNSAPLH
ncbi:hypothetical protein PAXINDRAFT_8662 [Paxillus involutus ATCC 200175]|nr:hypothetical protein PAXINDRAFT_8662 [Paxillus involutus ATCC 200175]